MNRLLRVPLLGKLVGANAGVLLLALIGHWLRPDASDTMELAVALSLSFSVTTFLVWLALRPIVQLEATAERVADGDFSARVPLSPLADRDAMRLADTMNRLLERVDADRARIQYLAGRAVRARDIEREAVARELRESFAQTVAATSLQLAAAQRVNRDIEVEQQIERARNLVTQLTQEMRDVADTLYPGTLGEFGLPNALQALARRARRTGAVAVSVSTEGFHSRLPAPAASALYRVADEALRNLAQHANASQARVTLRSDSGVAILEVEDDGRGIDLRRSDPMQAGLGLFSARAVLALAGGDLQISSAPGRGTRVSARVPLAGQQPSDYSLQPNAA
jgi:two-component system sensor histidine kinase UhpB